MNEYIEMTDYIEREELLHEVVAMPLAWEYGRAVEDIYNKIKAFPPADVAPVRHGRWLPPVVGSLGALCSECETQSDNAYNFCPNCGAKMDLEDQT